jgi:hypothetical protein
MNHGLTISVAEHPAKGWRVNIEWMSDGQRNGLWVTAPPELAVYLDKKYGEEARERGALTHGGAI